MAIVTYNGTQYECSIAYKGDDYIHLVDGNGKPIVCFDGVCNFDNFSISDGTWSTPADNSACSIALFGEDGFLRKCSNLSFKQGGTNATTVEEARQKLNYIGTNPIASTNDDTPANWAALGTGHAYFNVMRLNNQPTTYGFVENIVSGKYVFQTFYSMNGKSPVWHRSGNADGWYSGSANWVKPLDETSVLDMVYPVGAVYISYEPTSPAELFGGTWIKITGVFPYFNAGTDTGGSNTHTLTAAQMPSHNHFLPTVLGYQAGANNKTGGSNGGNWTAFESSGYAGSNQSHNNMPAYQTFYAWRRTA